VESRGTIEFRYADGRVVTGDYEDHAPRHLTKGAEVEFDGTDWVMYDRVDRAGVTVYLCRPVSLTLVDGGVTLSDIEELRAKVTRLRNGSRPPDEEPEPPRLYVVRDDGSGEGSSPRE